MNAFHLSVWNEMPHLVEFDLCDFAVDRRLRGTQSRLANSSVNQRAVAPEYLSKHVVRPFAQRIKHHAKRFQRRDFITRPRVAFDKMHPAFFAFVPLLPPYKSALHDLYRMAILALHHDHASFLYEQILS
jgi:hypothetical protein